MVKCRGGGVAVIRGLDIVVFNRHNSLLDVLALSALQTQRQWQTVTKCTRVCVNKTKPRLMKRKEKQDIASACGILTYSTEDCEAKAPPIAPRICSFAGA
jgi:hypothetical protein